MQETDFKWFLDNYDNLFHEYGPGYLSIKDKRVLGHYKTYAEGVKNTAKTEKIGTFIVQLCDGTEAAYTNYISSVDFA